MSMIAVRLMGAVLASAGGYILLALVSDGSQPWAIVGGLVGAVVGWINPMAGN